MPNQYTPVKRTIGELLSLTNPPIVVPDWQRNFSWSSSEAETFWQDLVAFEATYPGNNIAEQEYFLGSIVIVDNTTSHLLLDGQQRLATSAILLSVIRDYLARYNRDAATRLSSRYLTDYDDAAGRTIYKLTLNVYDRDFFKREVLEDRLGNYQPPVRRILSHRLIREVRETFDQAFAAQYANRAPMDAHAWALRIYSVLVGHVSVVAVLSTDEDNAAAVFETLNDRGIGLSTPDLLRNFLLRRAPDDAREEIVELWGDIFEIDEDVNVDVFLRHYWLSHKGDVKTRSLYREIKDTLQNNDQPSLEFSRDLAASADVYRSLLTAQVDDDELAKLLRDVRELGANLLYPLLLAGWSCGNPEALRQLARSAVVTYVRYSAVGKLESSRLETFIYNLARDVRANCDVDAAITRCRDFSPTDDQFRRQFAEVSIMRRDTARYILRELEHKLRRTRELDVAPPSRVHVEHIYPQTPQAGQRWQSHAGFVNRIGNMTLLDKRLNTSIKNADFPTKKPKYEASELQLTRDLLARTDWTPDIIDERQRELAAIAVDIWRL